MEKKHGQTAFNYKRARQIGKTESINQFAMDNYKNVVNINFALEPKYKTILSDGYSVEDIIKNISLIDPSKKFIEGDTLIILMNYRNIQMLQLR